MLPLVNYNSKLELRSFLDERGLGMRKKFGQNFLINPAIRSRLLDALDIKAGDHVWEIGPGLGAMTWGLLEKGAHVKAFEIDRAFINILKEIFVDEIKFEKTTTFGTKEKAPSLSIIEGDVLKTWAAQKVEENENLFLLGNLPYNIAASLLADFIEKGFCFKRMVVTIQKEVAKRMTAKPGSPDYSSFSVLCSSLYKVSLIQNIGSSSFYPVPNVDSSGIRLELLPQNGKKPELFYSLVRSLFSGRRKTIRNTLTRFASSVIIKKGVSIAGADAAEEVLKKTGICGKRRPETLEIDEFAYLAAILEEIITGECS